MIVNVAPAAPVKGPPICELQGNKWVVENQVGNEVNIDKTEIKHVVYIYNCHDCTIKVNGKINALTVGYFMLM
jgi:adenylyl cyclase-associated protein